MGALSSLITSLTVIYSTVYSGADQRKHQSSASVAFVRRIRRWPMNSQYDGKWPETRKMFSFDDVIMIKLHLKLSSVVLPSLCPVGWVNWTRLPGMVSVCCYILPSTYTFDKGSILSCCIIQTSQYYWLHHYAIHTHTWLYHYDFSKININLKFSTLQCMDIIHSW